MNLKAVLGLQVRSYASARDCAGITACVSLFYVNDIAKFGSIGSRVCV